MFDWFTHWRIKDERYPNSSPAHVSQVLPNYRLSDESGRIVSLSDFETPLVLVFLPSAPRLETAYFLRMLPQKFHRVRGKQTRFLVVTCPEYLSTVVALCGHLPVAAAQFDDLMLELVPGDSPVFYVLGPQREVLYWQEEEDKTDSGLLLAA
jgi:hypothetical protein